MSEDAGEHRILLGEPVPWFSARTVTGGRVDLHVDAGRWVILAFLGRLDDARAAHELAELLAEAELFNEDRLVVYGIVGEPPSMVDLLSQISGPALNFIADYDGGIAAAYGAAGSPRTIVLDPLLRAVANVEWDADETHSATVRGFLRQLPPVDESAGVELSAPVLIVPRVFEFELCDFLVDLHQSVGGTDSGFLLDRDGKTVTVVDHALKRRQDYVIGDAQVCRLIRERVVGRLLPAMAQYLNYRPTRMDRYMVSCYDAVVGGHFYRHRDNVNAGAQHRRYAVSINLNKDYDGCDLVFPEFGRRAYRAPFGGAVVFSCGLLHQVTPITRGQRYAFVPFLYGEADAELRLANNARLEGGEAQYTGADDALFPQAAE